MCRSHLNIIPITMIYGYIRVSTDRQTVENQRFEINAFCRSRQLRVDGWIEETISGICATDKRELGHLLETIRKDDLIICAELSRLGRNLYMIMEILNLCMRKECRLYTVKEGYRLGEDIQSKVLAFAFGLSAEIERNLVSSRTREALAARKAEGKHLGRPEGSKSKVRVLEGRREEILAWLAQGESVAVISERMGVCKKTFYTWWKGESV